MNPDIKEQWVAALRSGEYKQGAGRLQDPQVGEFCCLGVLCDLAVKAGVQVSVTQVGYEVAYGGNTGSLPTPVQEWAGLDSPDPELAESYEPDDGNLYPEEASSLNDSGMPFSQIADLIDWAL